MSEEGVEGLEGILETSRYELIKVLGRGTWGVVYEAKDKAVGSKVAIKVLDLSPEAEVQLEYRQLTPYSAMVKEELFSACANIVPRRFEIDENGRPFIVMPVYSQFLSEVLNESPKKDNRRSVGNQRLSENQAIMYAKDIAKGISELHNLKRTHGDLKPDNIAISSEGILHLNDLGTSTCTTFSWAKASRDNMGFVNTRSPENFYEERPNEKSDIYSIGCIIYRMFSKDAQYPLEEEIVNSDSQTLWNNREELEKIIKKRIRKNIPRPYRKLLMGCLDYNSYNRPDIDIVIEEIERIELNRTLPGKLIKFAKTLAWISGPLAIVSWLGYSVYSYEPQELGIPDTQINLKEIKGSLGKESSTTDYEVEIEAEDIKNLPETMDLSIGMNSGFRHQAKRNSENRLVAYFGETYAYAMEMNRGTIFRGFGESITEYQINLFENIYDPQTRNYILASQGPMWPIIINSIEFGLNKSAEQNKGKIDLEDAMVMTRIGSEKVLAAKNRVGSNDYIVYRTATDYSTGELIIPEAEQKFAETWLAYYYADY